LLYCCLQLYAGSLLILPFLLRYCLQGGWVWGRPGGDAHEAAQRQGACTPAATEQKQSGSERCKWWYVWFQFSARFSRISNKLWHYIVPAFSSVCHSSSNLFCLVASLSVCPYHLLSSSSHT
jgi:hypothetical protein